MKFTRKHLLAGAAFSLCLFSVQQLISEPNGAPAGSTGSPGDGGATCFQSGCHFGSPTTQAGMITSNVPSSGYVPGTTYTITATVTGTGAKGFQISPQNGSGQLVGQLTSGSGNFITGSKYITHSSAKTGSTATWSFSWKAPSAGTGAVTFYGAFAITRNTTKASTLVVSENTTTGIQPVIPAGFAVYPNPASNLLFVTLPPDVSGRVQVDLYDMGGRRVAALFSGEATRQLEFARPSALPAGLYLLRVSGDQVNETTRLVLN